MLFDETVIATAFLYVPALAKAVTVWYVVPLCNFFHVPVRPIVERLLFNVEPASKTICFKALQFMKADSPIEVTLDGIEIEVKLVQEEKA